MTDAQKLKDFRKDKNLTQQQLADILGIAQQTIAMVETNKRKAPDSLKLAILRKYKIDFDENTIGSGKMTTDIERQFFETFQIKPEYQDACTVEDKYWDNEELANEYGTFDQYMNCKCGNQENCTAECSCAYQKEIYPQITDSHYLQLVCWVNERRIFQNFDVDGLKKYVLKELCTMTVTEQFKQQVQSLFKER